MRNPSRAVFQFYPSSDDQIQLITTIAQKAGFGGGIVVDYPNSKKAKKVFLCLFVGGGGSYQNVPEGLQGEEEEDTKARFERRRERDHNKAKNSKQKNVKVKDWILKKKEVRAAPIQLFIANRNESFTASEEKKEFPKIPNSQDASGKQYFKYISCTLIHTSIIIKMSVV